MQDTLHTRNAAFGPGRFLKEYLPHFSFSFLGTAFVLVWIQCILYARYIWVDSGFTTIAINFSRCAFIIILAAFALRSAFSPRAERMLSWISITLMTIASLLFYLQAAYGMTLFVPASICAGVGLTWGGGAWIKFYMRLGIREALFCAFSSLALSTLIGVFIGLVAQDIAYFISILLPVMTFVMYLQAQKTLDGREQTAGPLPSQAVDNIYASEPISTVIRLAAGLAFFSFVLGLSRGFPYGPSIELPPLFQIMQHLGVAGIGCFIIWWVLIRGRGLKFGALWQAQLAALAVGVVLLATLQNTASLFGATLIAITNLFQVGFLWFLAYDAARHYDVPAYLVVGFFWVLHLFFREAGRLTMLAMGGSSIEQMLIIAAMICLIVISVAFLLTDSIPHTRPFFSELCCPKARLGLGVFDSPQVEERASDSADENPEDAQAQYVRHHYNLTKREAEVVHYLSEGRSTSYIANTLYLSDNTVKSYVKNIYAKMDVHSKQDLIDLMQSLEVTQ
ncbi:MAG: LuxR family transcriptional regulator [Raoultibacter sp.]